MANTLKDLEFSAFMNESIANIHGAINKSLIHLLIQALFLARSPLQEEVYARWIQYKCTHISQISATLKGIIYCILTKPIDMQMGATYFQLFGDAPDLRVPTTLPSFKYVLQLYPMFQPYFQTTRTIAPHNTKIYAAYKYNSAIHSVLPREILALNFLQLFVDPGNPQGYDCRRHIVNSTLRELFIELQKLDTKDLPAGDPLRMIVSVARQLNMTHENPAFGYEPESTVMQKYDSTPSYADYDG